MSLRIAKGRSVSVKPPIAEAKILPVPHIEQQETNWCWAGCTEMVLQYYGTDGVQQCEMANWLFKSNGCCSAPSGTACNQPCLISKISTVYRHWGTRAVFHKGQLEFPALKSELDADRPVVVGVEWTGGGGHVVIIRGVDQAQVEPRLKINDPDKGIGFHFYADVVTAYGYGTWKWTWLGIEKAKKIKKG